MVLGFVPTIEGGKHECTQCGRQYKTKPGLRLHLRNECGKEPQFACQFCPYKSHHKGSVKRHVFGVHSDIVEITEKSRMTYGSSANITL